MTTLELAAAQMKAMRCSFPPYYVAAITPDGWPVGVLSGDAYKMLESGLAPSAIECREILIHLRQELRWSRPNLAAFMGVNPEVLRRWETGERKPSGAARRLIWLLNMLARQPDQLKTAFDLIVWGRGEELLNVTEALEHQCN